MIDSFYLAWRYLSFNRWRTLTLVGCVTLIALLPLALQLLLDESERQLTARAASTPLVVGAKGSALDLVMNALYFGEAVPEAVTLAASESVWASDLALAIPMYVRYRARGYPIVGTTLDYFDFRQLRIATGRSLAVLGECVLGNAVAERLNLQPGDNLVSSPENPFDLAGVYPLKMTVVGVLEKTHTADDQAVFVDLKTAWVIEGLGHGHEDVAATQDASVVLSRTEDKIVANAKLVQYAEITAENIDSFHFHGHPDSYPITAVIAVPHDEKAGTLLRGRYLEREDSQQIMVPGLVIDTLLQTIFRIKNVLDAVIGLVGLATALALMLVFALSLRLRQREIQTIFKLGCRRLTIVRLVSAEILLIAAMSTLLCAAVLLLVDQTADDLVRALFIR